MARRNRRDQSRRRRGGFIRSIIRAVVVSTVINWVLRRLGLTKPKRAS